MSNLTRAETRARAAQLTVHEYRVELDLAAARDPEVATYPTATMLRLTSTGAETWLDFLGHVVHRVTVDGREQPVRHEDGRITVQGLPTDGTEATVVVHGEGAYSRTGEGLHRFVDPVDGETYLYTQYEPADARRVFANLEQPDLKAPFSFVVTAPAEWQVLSNSAAGSVIDDDGGSRTWAFAPTPPLATYLTAVVAGPYHRETGHWSGELADGTTLEVHLGVWCRASLAEYLDAEEILTVTKHGLDLFHDDFAYPYPWGKYDQIFVPEYNLGAMENPGLVTFTERYVFRSQATEAQREARATTILHEMAHMWFGNLATMRWWDDLWLKESFADYMGTHATAAVTRFTEAWTSFALRRKGWAYRQDQLPTTHPIVADIPDLEAAKQNFDGITYAKGAAVLKQLVAFVGPQTFREGARAYFRAHAFGSTTLADLLTALEEAAGRDLRQWAAQWLQTSGPATLTARLDVTEPGPGKPATIASLRIHQDDDRDVLREHRAVVGLYTADDDGALVRTNRIELELSGTVTDVPQADDLPVPDLVVVNDDDLTYAKVHLDGRSTTTALERAGTIPASLSRAVVWAALWNATRDAALPAADFLDSVLRQAPQETEVGILRVLLARAATAVEHYVTDDARGRSRDRLAQWAWEGLGRAAARSDGQLEWARAFADAAARSPRAAAWVREALDGDVTGLPLDPDLRWSLWQALAAVGEARPEQLDAELAREDTATTRTARRAALAGRPDAQAKADAWHDLGLTQTGRDPLAGSELSNDEVDAVIEGFGQPLHAELLAGYVDAYFPALTSIWAGRSIEIAERLVRGLFPSWVAAHGEEVADHPVVRASREWLVEHDDASAALRRCLVEELDDLERALRARRAA